MIEIKVTDKKLEIRGHAGYSKNKEDIVCAAVSILAYTFIRLNDAELLEYTVDSIVATYDKDTDVSFIKMGFELLKEEYPNNIRIT